MMVVVVVLLLLLLLSKVVQGIFNVAVVDKVTGVAGATTRSRDGFGEWWLDKGRRLEDR
jgi:hypothetical protein